MVLKKWSLIAVMAMGVASYSFASSSLDDRESGKEAVPILTTSAPPSTTPVAAAPVLSREALEEKLKGTLGRFSQLHLVMMMNVAPITINPTILTDLLNQTMDISCAAAEAGSTLGRICFRSILDYNISVLGEDSEQSLGLKARLPVLDEQLMRFATEARDPIALQYLKDIGKLAKKEEATPAVEEDSEAYKQALKIVSAEDEWRTKTDEERLEAVKGLAERDPKVWDIVVNALKPVGASAEEVKSTMGLAGKAPEERLRLLDQVKGRGIESAQNLYIQAVLGNFNENPFKDLTTYLGILDLPAEFNANEVSLTQTIQLPGFDRPVEANYVIANRVKGLFDLALNAKKLAQKVTLSSSEYSSSAQNLLQWWQNKRKATQLRIIQEHKTLNESAKAAAIARMESEYSQIETQLLRFWGFVFPIVNVM